MARRNLSIEAASYLRGQAYNAVKHDRGGDHRSSRSKGHVYTLIQAARQIALAYGVSPRTIKRDGRFAKAVDHVAGTSPIDAKRLLLSHGAKVTQRYVLKLARLAVADIRR